VDINNGGFNYKELPPQVIYEEESASNMIADAFLAV